MIELTIKFKMKLYRSKCNLEKNKKSIYLNWRDDIGKAYSRKI